MKMLVGISACLLGENVRYDAGHKRDAYLTDVLGRFVEWYPLCPEVGCGLPVPRPPMHLEAQEDRLRLVASKTGEDHTQRMLRWTAQTLDKLETTPLCGFVFKTRSPSSGLKDAKYYTPQGMPAGRGPGLFAHEFIRRFPLLPVEDEGRLNNAALRENFITRLFVMHRWETDVAGTSGRITRLIDFHEQHKLLIMAHSPAGLKQLGRLVAEGRRDNPELRADYLAQLMQILGLRATVRKNVNVLQHIMGYFKQNLDADEKQELLEVIGEYHAGLVPLIVPVTLLQHYVRKYDQPYLRKQVYLHPFPEELMLRNHV
ncbi:MAG: YbgA family protein [Kiritimatiellia bacterium]